MDPLRLVARCVTSYVVLLLLLRLAGARSVKHASPLDFVVALIVGDLIDDALWAEVPIAQFIVASATLVLAKFLLTAHRALHRW